MEDMEHLRRTLEFYRQQRQQKLAELQRIEGMIAQLEADLGEQPSGDIASSAASSPLSTVLSDILAPFRQPGTPTIRPDEFFGMSQSEAAKAYLRKVGHAVSFDELVSALRNGGATLGGADPKKTLYVSLARNPKKEFVWPQEGIIGLGEFYNRKDSGT
jgi:hypothetical protein